jgi:predicted DNA-binding transcriptional regulator AlpA
MSKPKIKTPYAQIGQAGGRRKPALHASTTAVVQRQGDRASGDDDEAATRKFLTGPQVAARYQISDMSLYRWLQDATLGFPPPAMRIRDRRYWLIEDLVRWERSHIPHGDDAVSPA